MTTSALLRVLLRRWYVAAVGLVLTAVGVASLLLHPGVYWTQVDVLFLSPSAGTPAFPYVSATDNLTAMAGLVEREVNSGRPRSVSTTSDVALVGTGVRHGTRVVLPNAGGQWNYNFSPMLSVQAAGSSPSEVLARRDHAVRDIRHTLRRLQAEAGTGPRYMVTTRLSPERAPVLYANGHPARAAGSATLLGLAITVLLTVFIDRRLLPRLARRRSVRRRALPSRSA